MSSEISGKLSSESDCNLKETELTLGIPGAKTSTKRAFSHTLDTCQNQMLRSKEQVVGWPPVRASRKNAMKMSCKLVKVAVDGAPYLRKVDLQMYNTYDHLMRDLETMFSGLAIHLMNEKKLMPTYEDKDGDWMLVGDVPWNMFVESCKRIRLMISSDQEAVALAPGPTSSKCTGST